MLPFTLILRGPCPGPLMASLCHHTFLQMHLHMWTHMFQLTLFVFFSSGVFTAGSPISEFALTEESCIVGKFDPDLGPVEVDLENFPNADYISRNHARVFWDRGQWKVEDNDSANGVFLKKSNESRFTKITTVEVLEAGDEVSFAKIRFTFQF